MNDLIKKAQTYVMLVGLIGGIGSGFYGYGQLMLRVDQIEAREFESVDLAPLEKQIAILEEKVSKLEKAADNNKNPLAQWKKNITT